MSPAAGRGFLPAPAGQRSPRGRRQGAGSSRPPASLARPAGTAPAAAPRRPARPSPPLPANGALGPRPPAPCRRRGQRPGERASAPAAFLSRGAGLGRLRLLARRGARRRWSRHPPGGGGAAPPRGAPCPGGGRPARLRAAVRGEGSDAAGGALRPPPPSSSRGDLGRGRGGGLRVRAPAGQWGAAPRRERAVPPPRSRPPSSRPEGRGEGAAPAGTRGPVPSAAAGGLSLREAAAGEGLTGTGRRGMTRSRAGPSEWPPAPRLLPGAAPPGPPAGPAAALRALVVPGGAGEPPLARLTFAMRKQHALQQTIQPFRIPPDTRGLLFPPLPPCFFSSLVYN
ncbi:translation initiation factor IF-2-like [Falco peregrinus]|uniref:translation initiation factor IF-2-like n=1 Tax=Falco peregrinus TaxID=8954 RepID=UPI00247A2B46|nr:translation initiation factor IF-2-like [Falco peregrinus]XP_055659733.1 translation initiation factor IF-2-like [Falco peregrinus]XP_055659734.1 translation initiation factor IF-2-like [Falco peregrinus]